jgi:hypothetical protein
MITTVNKIREKRCQHFQSCGIHVTPEARVKAGKTGETVRLDSVFRSLEAFTVKGTNYLTVHQSPVDLLHIYLYITGPFPSLATRPAVAATISRDHLFADC